MHRHRWNRWWRIAFCAVLVGGGVSINLGLSPARAGDRPKEERDYRTDTGRQTVKLDDFLESLDKITAAVNSLADKIAKDPCINEKKYNEYMLSLNNAIVALDELTDDSYRMYSAVDKSGVSYISLKQRNSYLTAIEKVQYTVFGAKRNLKERPCPWNQDAMVPLPKSTASDDDWPDPGEHANVVHKSTDPYPQRGEKAPGGRPYNWPGGGEDPGQDRGPYPGPDSGDYPGPGGGAYPVPGGGAYPGPGGM